MCTDNEKLILFANYIRKLDVMEIEIVDADAGVLIFDLQNPMPEKMQMRYFQCILICKDDLNKQRAHITVRGLGSVSDLSNDFLKKLTELNDSYEQKLYFDEDKELFVSFFSTTEMMGEEQNEWMLVMLSEILTFIVIAYEDLGEFLE